MREVLDRYDVHPARALGQNFVLDPNTIRKVVETAGVSSGDTVLEIGAGAGSLTLGLAGAARRVVAVEFDRRLAAALREVVAGVSNVEVVEADALRLDLSAFDAAHLVANLPYNIATPLVVRALEQAPRLVSLTVMTQREVGERLAARPGSKAYGQVSVVVGYFAVATVAASVSRRAFYPEPNVDSVIVRMVRKPSQPEVDRRRLFEIVRHAFSQRRKTLRNALTPLAGSTASAEDALRRAALEPQARAEDVDLDGFVALARALT